MRFPLRRIVLGFAVGAGAGWVAGLLRRPKDAPAGTSAGSAVRLPQEEFGELPGEEEHAPPRKAVPEMVTPPPGRTEEPPAPGEATAEPAKPAKAAKPGKPAKRARTKADPVSLVAEPMNEAVREGREAMNERLAGIDVTPPEPRRRPRKTT